MKGLLTKDLLTIQKKYGMKRFFMDISIIIALMSVLEGTGAIYISFLLIPLEVASMVISLTTCDEQWKWGKYAISYFCFPAYRFGFYLFIAIASFCVTLIFLSFTLPSNYSLGVNAGFAAMIILVVLLVVLGIWSKLTDNAIMWFIVEHFETSMGIAFVSTILLFALSYALSTTFFIRKYV